MKIAISIFQNRVSPVFDWSRRLLIIYTEDGVVTDREYREIGGKASNDRALSLDEISIDVLVCGGISAQMFTLVEERGIRIAPWVAGDVEDVLKAFLAGRIPGEDFAMPGCCGHRHRQHQKGNGHGIRYRKREGPGGPPQ